MKRWAIFALLTVCLAAGLLLTERRAISHLRQQQTALLQDQEKMRPFSAEERELTRWRALVATPSLPENVNPEEVKSELLRLRNQVRQLREAVPEVETFRAENERLQTQVAEPPHPPPRLADLPGFVAKETWHDAGLATPEDTLQTFVNAINAGDLPRVLQCLAPAEAEKWQTDFEKYKERSEASYSMRRWPVLLRGSGYRVVRRRDDWRDGLTRLELQVAGDGVLQAMDLRRYGAEWKVEFNFQPVQQEP